MQLFQQLCPRYRNVLDDILFQRFLVGERRRGTHGFLGPVGIAAITLGKRADVGNRIVHNLAIDRRAGRRVLRIFGRFRLRFVGAFLQRRHVGHRPPLRLGRREVAAQGHGRGGADTRRRRHGRDVAGQQDVGAGARGARAGGRDVGRNGHARAQDALDDIPGGADQSPGRVDLQDNQLGLPGLRVLDTAEYVIGGCHADAALDFEDDDRAAGRAGVEGEESAEYGNQGPAKSRFHGVMIAGLVAVDRGVLLACFAPCSSDS